MARTRKNLTDTQKKKRRREQKTASMRRAREKLKQDPEALEEKRRKDREYYHRKKSQGKIKTVEDLPDVQKKLLRNKWRENARRRREKIRIQKEAEKYIARETPPSSPVTSVSSRAEMGARIAMRNRRRLKVENHLLKKRLMSLECKLTKYRMRLHRLQKKKRKDAKETQKKKRNEDSKKDKELRDNIQQYLLSDESSRLTSGKKETITRNKQKKQVRFLNDSLINLHKKYMVQTGKNVSYKTFCRHRPFWVLDPKTAARETCLCVTHTNMEYIAKALKNARVINENTAMAISKSICCTNMTENCLERTCTECKQKKIAVKGQKKMCQKTLKETVYTSKRQVVNHLLDNIERFMQHTCNVLHQHASIKNIKVAMSENEGLLHVDFSENYNCKYATEIQSAHFGGSNAQLSLHTSVFYYVDVTTEENRLVSKSFCTVSENRNHDPIYICIHLKPIIAVMKTLVPNLKRLHILSDGPSTQYRNKTMFHLIAAYLSEETNADDIIWHYSESGHGKGAPDGVGGCLKRMADKHVAQGNDVHNVDAFMECVHQTCKGIEVIRVDETHMESVESKIINSKITPFRGTIKVHQVTWSRRQPIVLQFRRLSCMKCSPENTCIHYDLGCKNLDIAACSRLLQNNVPTLSSSALTTPLQSPSRNDTPAPTERMYSPSLILTSMHLSPVASRWSSPIPGGSMRQPLKFGECSPSPLMGGNILPTLSSSALTTPLQSPNRNDTPAPTERMNSPSLVLTPMHSLVASRWSSPIPGGSMRQPLKVGECSSSRLIGANLHKRIKFSNVYSNSSNTSTSEPEEPPNPTLVSMGERIQRFWSSDDEDIF